MVVLGHESTVPVTVDEMLFLTRAVDARRAPAARGRRHAVRLVPGLRRAGRRDRGPLREGGRRRRVKLEGGGTDRSRARARSSSAGIPVMGHVGLTPQSATMLGGFKAQGRTAEAAQRLVDDAQALEDGGLLRDRARGGAGAGRARGSRGRSRSRRSGSAPARTATARCSSTTTCSASTEGHAPASSSGTRTSPARSATRSRRYASEVRSGAFPEEQHTYAMPDGGAGGVRELELVRECVASDEQHGQRGRERDRARRAPQLQPCTARTPTTSSSRAPGERRRRRARRRSRSPRSPVVAAGAEELTRRRSRAAPARP